MRRLAVNAAMIAAAVAAGLGLVEGALRVAPGTPVSDDRPAHFIRTDGALYARRVEPYHIALAPSAVATIETAEYRLQYFINSLGFRDYEFTPEKPAGVLRVAAVGDSITFGTGVELEQTFAKVLERRLNARPELSGRKVEVLNLGVGAASAGQNLLRIRRDALAFDADLVLYAYYANDAMEWPYYPDPAGVLPQSYVVTGEHWDRVKGGGAARAGQREPIPPPGLLVRAAHHSRAMELALIAWNEWLNPPHLSPGSDYAVGDPWNDPFWQMRPEVRRERVVEWDNHLQIVRATVAEVLQADRAFLGAVLPVGAAVNDFEWDEGRTAHFFARGRTHDDASLRDVVDAIAQAGGEAIYLKPALADASRPDRRMFLPYDGHLTPAGHDAVARALEEAALAALTARP